MKQLFCLLIAIVLLIAACDHVDNTEPDISATKPATAPITVPDTFPNLENNVSVMFVEGTPGCYSINGDTILFSGIQNDSVYSISGEWTGNIMIDVDTEYKFELEMQDFSLASDTQNPIAILRGNRVTLTAKKNSENFIYDRRAAVNSDAEELDAGAIYAECDLTIAGKGSLMVLSSHNNGIHTKDDLEVKNLNLSVVCVDNALKGNDSVTITNGNINLIAKQGDGIKTSNSNISEKGNQRGTVKLSGCVLNIYAACDGIDASYDVIIENAETMLNIYTDQYSEYSESVEDTEGESDVNLNYIRYTEKIFSYAVKYYNSDSDYLWITAEYHSAVSGGRTSYYYYSFPQMSGYDKIQYFGYTSDQLPGQEDVYAFCTDVLSVNADFDTFALTMRGNSLRYSWTNYTTKIEEEWGGPGGMGGHGGMGGPGGMNDGNPNKGDYSTKGIKAANSIHIIDGTIYIHSYDDAIHANQDSTLENGSSPVGNVTISGGNITVFSNDDGIHADGSVVVEAGVVRVAKAYEGLEGMFVTISGGEVSVFSTDDGVNATATSGEAINVSGGGLYVYAGGDGLDSNSTTSYGGIIFSGGNTVVITNSNGNSAIDSERGYRYTGGYVLAITPSGGMSGETINCQNLTSVGTKTSLNLTTGKYVNVKIGLSTAVIVQMPCSMNATVVFLGSKGASITSAADASESLDGNGVYWKVS